MSAFASPKRPLLIEAVVLAVASAAAVGAITYGGVRFVLDRIAGR